MKNSITLLLVAHALLGWIGVSVWAQSGRVTIGGMGSDYARSIVQTTDGGYIVAGNTWSYGQGGADVYVVKLDASGDIQWTRTVGGGYNDKAYSIIQLPDGSYVLAGYTFSYGQGGFDVYIVKLDATGNVQWTRTVGGTADEIGYSIIQAADGGYVVTGYTESYGQGDRDVYVLKLNGSGTVQWTRTVGGANSDAGFSIVHAADSGYAITGWSASYGQGGRDVYVLKLNRSGNVQWTRTVGGPADDVSFSIVQTFDGGYAVGGWTRSYGQGSADVYVLKLDGGGGFTPSPSCAEGSSSGGLSGSGATSSSGGKTSNGGLLSSGGVFGSGGSTALCGSVCALDTAVMRNGDTLTASAASATYQWLDCDAGYAPITGATGRNFVPTRSGTYAVMISQGGCTDTSSCHAVTIISAGVTDVASEPYRFRYDGAYVRVTHSKGALKGYVEILDGTGRLLIRRQYRHQREVAVPVGMLPPGVYALRVIERNAYQVFRFVRSR